MTARDLLDFIRRERSAAAAAQLQAENRLESLLQLEAIVMSLVEEAEDDATN